MKKTALIGYGYWGKNIARVIAQSSEFSLNAICDTDEKSLASAKKLYPGIVTCKSHKDLPTDIEVVAIIVPTHQHFELGRWALNRGTHVLITKPFVPKYEEAEELLNIAERKNLTAFADYTFVFNPAVRSLKSLLPKVGKPLFVLSQRLNLGLFQPDANVVMDLMPHDVSILSYLFDCSITKATGFAYATLGFPQEDFAHTRIEMDNAIHGLVTVSWLSPYKVRNFIVVGDKGMLSYDDVAVSEKVKFYDRGISTEGLKEFDSTYTARISYRSGDLYSPAIPNFEALALEMTEFGKAVADKKVREQYNKLNLNVCRGLSLIQHGMENGK